MRDELTEIDIKKMREEIEYRKNEVAPKLRAMVKAAKEQGDLSENDGYHSARREFRANETRIAYLEEMIKSAVVIKVDSKSDEVGLFDEVDVHYIEDDEDGTVRIVTTLRNDVTKNCISKESPMGKALLGKKAGDKVTVKVSPDYSYTMTVLAIRKGTDDDSLPISKY